MLAVPAAPFDFEDFSFEVKWDGVRVLAAVEESSWRLWGREGTDYTARSAGRTLESDHERSSEPFLMEATMPQPGRPNAAPCRGHAVAFMQGGCEDITTGLRCLQRISSAFKGHSRLNRGLQVAPSSLTP
jgi:hypothetical protein